MVFKKREEVWMVGGSNTWTAETTRKTNGSIKSEITNIQANSKGLTRGQSVDSPELMV